MTSETGARLREARRRLRLSQTAVGDFIGTTRQTVAAFETGTRKPDLGQLAGLANLYRSTLDELVGTSKSVQRVERTPAFLPRYNDAPNLPDEDRQELASFARYLRDRPASSVAVGERRPLDPVRDVVAQWGSTVGAFTTLPVPVFSILARLGIEVRFTAMTELAGALLLPEDGVGAHGVLVNSDQPLDRQRYSAAHEIGHLVLRHRAPSSNAFISHLGRRFDPREVQADQFASELLVPVECLRAQVEMLEGQYGDEAIARRVYRLSAVFQVSFRAMTVRLAQLGSIDADDVVALEKVKPSVVAKEIGEKSQRTTPFETRWIPGIAVETMPSGWHEKASADVVRLLQETVVSHYLRRVREGHAVDSAASVYEKVATWVAREYPVLRIT